MDKATDVDMQREFTRYPAGRYPKDGPWNGERFRKQFLVPAIRKKQPIRILLDSALSYGSSFLEEAFGGTIRELQISERQFFECVELVSQDESLLLEIKGYIQDAAKSVQPIH